MYALPLVGSVPSEIVSLPFDLSAVVNPDKVKDAIGFPAAVACIVRPVNPVAP